MGKMVAGGAWRRPRMKVYDYNQEFGGNYYQPMIQYINKKEVYGPFMKRQDVYLPHSAEVTSDKYTNMRYQDKSSAKHNLDEFLKGAYAKQMKELNGTTAMARVNMMKTIVTDRRQPHSPLDNVNTPYISELAIEKKNNHKLSAKERKHLVMLEACDDEYQYHYKLFGEGTGADRDMKFYAPQMVQDYINQIRRF